MTAELADKDITELVLDNGLNAPTLFYDGDPNRIRVLVPEAMHPYANLSVESLTPRHPHFDEFSRVYAAQLLNKGNLGHFTWPPFKIKGLGDIPPEDLLDADGNLKTDLDSEANDYIKRISDYIRKTIYDKGNHFLVLHGMVEGRPAFIGGGMSYGGQPSEDEGWIGKGIIAEMSNGVGHRRSGLGRALQEARIMHWMLVHPDKNNLNTAVNYESHGISQDQNDMMFKALSEMDVLSNLERGGEVTPAFIEERLKMVRTLLLHQGYTEEEVMSGGYDDADFFAHIKTICGEGFEGFTPEALERRKDVQVEVGKLFGANLAPTERTFLRFGADYRNTMPNIAVVATHPDELNHARRLLLERRRWEKLTTQAHPEIAPYLQR